MSYLGVPYGNFEQQTRVYSKIFTHLADNLEAMERLPFGHETSIEQINKYTESERTGHNLSHQEFATVLGNLFSTPHYVDFMSSNIGYSIERLREASKNLEILPTIIELLSGTLVKKPEQEKS